MPTYDYKCLDCEKVFEVIHGMDDKYSECNICGSKNIKKLISKVNFYVPGGTQKFSSYGYTGRHQDIVKRMKGDKNYRDGYRKEREQQERKGLSNWKAEREMKNSQEIFQKMKAEGEKMSPAEKQKIKEEFGIKKGMKTGKLAF